MPDKERSRKTVFWVVLAAGVFIAGIALANVDVLRFGTAGNSQNCLFQLAGRLPGADAVILGSSGMRRGIDPDQLATLISAEGETERVVNLGMPGRNTARSYVLLKGIVEGPNPPKTLIAEISHKILTDNRKTYRTGDRADFAAYADVGTLVEDMSSKRRQSWVLRVRDFLDQLTTKMEVAIVSVVTGRLAATLSPDAGIDRTRDNICWNKRFDLKQTGLEQQENLKAAFFETHDDWFDEGYDEPPLLFRDKVLERERYYLKAMASLARKRGVDIYFVLLPRFYVWPPDPGFAAEFEAEIGAPLLVPDKALAKAMIDGGYSEDGHLMPEARRLFTRFVGERIAGTQ